MSAAIKCVVVDDNALACERLVDLLSSHQNIEVCAAFTIFNEALEFLLDSRPEVVFLDVELDRNHTGFEMIGQFKQASYHPKVILSTAYEHYSIKGIKNGVFDYLLKPVDLDELNETIRRLERGLEGNVEMEAGIHGKLSSREKEVLDLVLKGRTSMQIARDLFVSKNTIDTHRKNILKKTGADSFMELSRRVNW